MVYQVSGVYPLPSGKASTLPSGNAWNACQPDTLIISQFQTKVKCFFHTTIGGVYIPALKVYLGGLTPKIMLKQDWRTTPISYRSFG